MGQRGRSIFSVSCGNQDWKSLFCNLSVAPCSVYGHVEQAPHSDNPRGWKSNCLKVNRLNFTARIRCYLKKVAAAAGAASKLLPIEKSCHSCPGQYHKRKYKWSELEYHDLWKQIRYDDNLGPCFLYYKFSIEHYRFDPMIDVLIFKYLMPSSIFMFCIDRASDDFHFYVELLLQTWRRTLSSDQGNLIHLIMIKWVNRRTFEQVDDGLHNRPLRPVLVVRRVENRAGDSFVMICRVNFSH